MDELVEKVRRELARYEHPLFAFDARSKNGNVEVKIRLRNATIQAHTYLYEMHRRDIEHPQFPWMFQQQLYNCLHDYIIEMFIRNPQMKE